MPFKRGAIHDANSPSLAFAIDFNTFRVGGATRPTDWFLKWDWQTEPDGDVLANNRLSCCCEVADLRLVQAWLASTGVAWAVPEELVILRYEAVAGYQGTPQTDNGTITQTDSFAWQAAPIVANGQSFNVRWLTVQPFDVSAALKRGPLLVTLGLPANDADDPDRWHNAPSGPLVDYHRVVLGAERGGLLDVHSYGRRYLVHPSRVVAADLMLHVDTPAELRTAGIDWAAALA